MEKNEISISKMTSNFIGSFLVIGILTGFIGQKTMNVIVSKVNIENEISIMIVILLIGAIMMYVTGYITCRLVIKSRFKKHTILEDNIPALVKNIFIFFIVLIILTGLLNYTSLESKTDDIYSSSEYRIQTLRMDEQEEIEFEKTAKKEIANQVFIIFIMSEIVYSIAFLAVIPSQKKLIENNL